MGNKENLQIFSCSGKKKGLPGNPKIQMQSQIFSCSAKKKGLPGNPKVNLVEQSKVA